MLDQRYKVLFKLMLSNIHCNLKQRGFIVNTKMGYEVNTLYKSRLTFGIRSLFATR